MPPKRLRVSGSSCRRTFPPGRARPAGLRSLERRGARKQRQSNPPCSEMIVDGSKVYPRFPGDVANGNTVETSFAEQFLGHIENPRSCIAWLFHTFVSNECMS